MRASPAGVRGVPRIRARRVLLGAVAVVSVAACGSTVQSSSTAVPGGSSGSTGESALGAPAGGAPQGTASLSDGHAPSRASSSAGVAGGVDSAATGGTNTTGRAGSSGRQGTGTHLRGGAGGLYPGVTATTVSIGVPRSDSSETNAYLNSFGYKGLTLGDSWVQMNAVVDYINKHGGAGGRKLVLVPHNVHPSDDQQSSTQAMCSTWTEDHRVFMAVVGGQTAPDNLVSCLASHGTISVGTVFADHSQRFYDKYRGLYYGPGSLEAIAAGRAYVDGLQRQGFFSNKDTVGVLYFELPSMVDALNLAVRPALQRLGIKNIVTESVIYPTANGDDGRTAQQAGSATLKFRSSGVNKVLMLDTGAQLSTYFIQAAASQDYYPKYGLWSGGSPAFTALNQSSDSLNGSMAVGWQPPYDVPETAIPQNAPRKLCRQIMKAANQNPSSEVALGGQLLICTSFFFIEQALNAATAINPAGVLAAVQRLGRVPTNAVGFQDSFGPGKFFGAATYRTLAYNAGCTCYRYTSSELPVP